MEIFLCVKNLIKRVIILHRRFRKRLYSCVFVIVVDSDKNI